MTAICTCTKPRIGVSEHGGKYCKICGHWWDIRYGSVDPDAPLATQIVHAATNDRRIAEAEARLRAAQDALHASPVRLRLNRGRTGGGRRRKP